jgi:hypothetical protein
MSSKRTKWLSAVAVFAVLTIAALPAYAAATIVIVNNDAPGAGFNDPTPVSPVGGNAGTTLGEQRLIAFQYAAGLWGAKLNSAVTIRVQANFIPLSCTASSAVLGSAGPTEVWSDSPGVPLSNYWYHFALANALAGTDLDPDNPQIAARFNSDLGKPTCLAGTFWYLGLDTAHGTDIDLVTVLLHEFAHGLGFSTVTNGSTGAYLAGLPSVFDHFLLDTSSNELWDQMTNGERVASALNWPKLVWNGGNVTANSNILSWGLPQLVITAPASAAAKYPVGTATFGPPLLSPGVSAEVMPAVDTAGNLSLACNPLSAANAAAVNGKIALLDRGTCNFTVKVKNAQNAGAVGVVIADNAPGSPPSGLGGADPTITIPAVRVRQADGVTLKNALRYRSRLHSGVFATIGIDTSVQAGADPFGRVLMFAPNPYQSGASVSHYDTSAFPNLLMEPNINGDLTHNVDPPSDLTLPLLEDIGWNQP